MSVKKLKASNGGAFSTGSNWAVLVLLPVMSCSDREYCILFHGDEDIPASTALAVWMGTALIGVKISRAVLIQGTFDVYQFVL